MVQINCPPSGRTTGAGGAGVGIILGITAFKEESTGKGKGGMGGTGTAGFPVPEGSEEGRGIIIGFTHETGSLIGTPFKVTVV